MRKFLKQLCVGVLLVTTVSLVPTSMGGQVFADEAGGMPVVTATPTPSPRPSPTIPSQVQGGSGGNNGSIGNVQVSATATPTMAPPPVAPVIPPPPVSGSMYGAVYYPMTLEVKGVDTVPVSVRVLYEEDRTLQ